ncbi:uncharacterized protein LOC142333047 isoform X2 [Lycorma delicatula]|uniref:uncharacterized protein LOC142333047 isoform X2 n=1 Tax=Lycorma delicatula TaxID=130591 RepID=UPI003F50D709
MYFVIYVTSFFIFSAMNVGVRGYSTFEVDKYVHHKKYPKLKASCKSFGNTEDTLSGYIYQIYKNIIPTYSLGSIMEKKIQKLKSHNHYKYDVIQLTVFQKENDKKETTLIPTVLQLLELIPNKIVIKRGIINSEEKSILSGIDITTTISNDFSSMFKNAYLSSYSDVEYVIMKGNLLKAYYKCNDSTRVMDFSLRPEETEAKIIKKSSIPCILRINSIHSMYHNIKYLTPILDKDLKDKLDEFLNKKIQFELDFSYICKFHSPLQAFLKQKSKVLQYKVLNFTISGYQLNTYYSSQTSYVGLTYCLNQRIFYNSESVEDFVLEDSYGETITI